MCDNIAALGQATADGSVIFGKNSDREPNEPHQVVIIPRANHPKKVTIQGTARSLRPALPVDQQ